MKNVIIAASGTCVLLMILLAAACTPPSPNSTANQSENTSASANANSVDPAVFGADDDACNEANIQVRRQRVYDRIKRKIETSSLAPQYAAEKFKFDVAIAAGNAPNSLYLLLEGTVSGKDAGVDLTRIMRDFVRAKCASRVFFVPKETIPLKAALTSDPGFEWTACDYPNVPCPGGECLPPGTCPNPMPTPSVNVNTNSRPVSPNTNVN